MCRDGVYESSYDGVLCGRAFVLSMSELRDISCVCEALHIARLRAGLNLSLLGQVGSHLEMPRAAGRQSCRAVIRYTYPGVDRRI